MRYWVYILRCADGSYYIGSHRGESPDNRASEHNDGIDRNAWTYSRRPVELVWTEEFQRPQDAIAVERQMKGWTRAKKEAAIAGQWSMLPQLAGRRTHSQGDDAAKAVARERECRRRR